MTKRKGGSAERSGPQSKTAGLKKPQTHRKSRRATLQKSSTQTNENAAPKSASPDDLTIKLRISPDPVDMRDLVSIRAQRILKNAFASEGTVPVTLAESHGSYGNAALVLSDPHTLLKLLITRIEESWKSDVLVTVRGQLLFALKRHPEKVDAMAWLAMSIFTEELEAKLSEALNELVDESLAACKTKVTALGAKRGRGTGIRVEPFHYKGGWSIPDIKTAIEGVISRSEKARKLRLENMFIKSGLHKHMPSASWLLKLVFDGILDTWKNARKKYKANKEWDSWRETVSSEYKYLPGDLINRLPGRPEYLTESEKQMIGNTGAVIGRVSHIALEHAARLCGARDYQCAVRYYDQLVKSAANQPVPRAARSHVIEI